MVSLALDSSRPHSILLFLILVLSLLLDKADAVRLAHVFPESNGQLLRARIKNMTFNCSSRVFTVATYPFKSADLRIVPDELKLKDANISFSVNLKNVSTLIVKFCGTWRKIEENKVVLVELTNVQMIYTTATDKFKIAANSSTLRFARKYLPFQVNSFARKYLPELYYIHKAGFGTFAISGMISNDSFILQLKTIKEDKKIYIVYHKPSSHEKVQTALAVDVPKTKVYCILAPFIDSVSKKRIADHKIKEVGIILSNDGMTGLRPDEFTGSKALSQLTSNGTIPDGVSATLKIDESPIKISLKGDIKQLGSDWSTWSIDNNKLILRGINEHANITFTMHMPIEVVHKKVVPEIKFVEVISDIGRHCSSYMLECISSLLSMSCTLPCSSDHPKEHFCIH